MKLPPKTIVIGAAGFLGRHFYAAYRACYPDCVGSTRQPAAGLRVLDLRQPDLTALRDASPLVRQGYREALIAAAITSYVRCEREKAETRRCNVEGTLELARQLHAEGLKVIWFSSDMVFDGVMGSYYDEAPPNPVFEYGRQKAAVEQRLPEVCAGKCLIVRIGKAFGLEKGDGTLLDAMAQKLARHQPVRGVVDQVFCPTPITATVSAVIGLQIKGLTGIVNVCSSEKWSRYDLALALAKGMGQDPSLVEPIKAEQLNDSFPRPQRTDLICRRLATECPTQFPPIAGCIRQVADHYG